ncbi:membrane-spanning 4-domains subfamily A member 15-like isoform X11 [Erythrolamprus reginae]|uniref:membrane-spanning 4-domains subfamily A member 15-like isoform X11 n=1 Tax=Erythrolamprus reginae TaxID=121349 RepID=UPI00396CC19E
MEMPNTGKGAVLNSQKFNISGSPFRGGWMNNLVVATLAARMASGTVFVHPSNRENIIQTAPGFPGVPLQAPGAIIYSQYGAQQLGIPTNAPQQVPQNSPLERFHKAEPKVLGVKSSAAMNIISAIMSLSGICLHLSELIINNRRSSYVYPYTDTDLASLYNIRYGVSCMLLLFSLLEFCIAVSLAHFGCQATCCGDDQPTMVFVPYQVIRGGAVAAEPNPLPPPPTYDNTVAKSE